MKGLAMMLKALNININPADVERMFEWLKLNVPAIAKFLTERVSSIDSRLAAIEARLTQMEKFSRPELVAPMTVQQEVNHGQ
jgi:hypothetical protein